MAKRRRSPVRKEADAAKTPGRWRRPDIKHTSVYLPEAAYEALRQSAALVPIARNLPSSWLHSRPAMSSS